MQVVLDQYLAEQLFLPLHGFVEFYFYFIVDMNMKTKLVIYDKLQFLKNRKGNNLNVARSLQ